MQSSGVGQVERGVQAHPSRSMRILAVFVGLIAVRQLFSVSLSDGFSDTWLALFRSDAVLATLTMAAFLTGAVAATGLWFWKSWVFEAYIVWVLVCLVLVVIAERRVEPVAWKVAIATVVRLGIPVIGAVFVYRSTRGSAAHGTNA